MSESSLVLNKSRYRQYLLVIAVIWGCLVFLLLPLHGLYFWLAGALLTAWFWLILRCWSAPFNMAVLHLDGVGSLHWQYVALPAGTLEPRSLIQAWLIVLMWRDHDGKQHRLWIFADQLADDDYRTLARHIQLQRWRKAASDLKLP